MDGSKGKRSEDVYNSNPMNGLWRVSVSKVIDALTLTDRISPEARSVFTRSLRFKIKSLLLKNVMRAD